MRKLNHLLLIFLLGMGVFTAKAQTIITLEQAMEIAEKNSPSLLSSLYNLERTQQSLNAQRAALKSKFSLTLNPIEYSQSRSFNDYFSKWNTTESFNSSGTFTVRQPIALTDGTISLNNQFGWKSNYSEQNTTTTESFFNNLYLSLSQPLFTYNRTKLQIKNLELDNENAMLSYAMQRLNLEKSVSQYFYNVYLAQMSLSIREDEFTNTQKSYDIIKNKVDAGLAAKEELFQAEVNLATAKSSVESGRVSLENAKDIFKQYIGLDIFDEISVMTDVNVTPVEIDSKKALEHGLASRMELRQRQINVETSQFDLIQTKASNEFSGSTSLSIGLAGDDPKFGRIYDSPTKSPRVSISFNVPIFDWGERNARIKAQEAVINSQKLSLTNQETQIKIDIRQVVRNLSNLKNQIDIKLQNQNNSQLTYDINLERYQNGDLTSMDLNLYQVQLSDNKMAYAQALINYKIELLNLKIQSLYDFTINEPVVPEKFFKDYQSNQK